MKIISIDEKLNSNTAASLGFFDGLHKGHKAVIDAAVLEKKNGLVPMVFTFDENPLKNLNKSKAPERLLDNQSKAELIKDMGVEVLLSIDFKLIKDFTPKEFVEIILKNKLKAKKVFCGFNFTFGRGGASGPKELKSICSDYGIEVTVIPPVLYKSVAISSTRIRKLLSLGDIEQVNCLLGRKFCFNFKVVEGRKIGRLMGTPTINQMFPKGFIIPRYGVYASEVEFDGIFTYGVTNIGIKPTFGSKVPLAETWMPEYNGEELYNRFVKVNLLKYIREEKKFNSMEELKQEIINNSLQSKDIFEKSKLSLIKI